MRIDAEGVHYRELNERLCAAVREGQTEIILENVRGQRYIGTGLHVPANITINGVPGNDLGAFLNGPRIVVNDNAQDGVGNTMNAGGIVIHGDAGDILGYSMRGGEIFVRGNVGYRCGIHMKAYGDRVPIVVIGGTAGDYLGEYMAGGVLIVLGMGSESASAVGEYVGTGMHGGVLYVRGKLASYQVGAEVGVSELDGTDWEQIRPILLEFAAATGLEAAAELRPEEFARLIPETLRPYGTLYAY